MEYSHLGGGLTRILDRLQHEGTATKDPDADQFLKDDANAILLGLLFDQRVLAETAFKGPFKMMERLGHLDMQKVADMEEEAFKAMFAEKPAIHRFTNTMAEKTQAVCKIVAEQYAGDAANIWKDQTEYKAVEKSIRKLPGFGPLKAKKLRFCLHYFGHATFADNK